MNQEIISAAIRRLREEQGMTQEALAARIGVSDKAVSKWETGKGLPDIGLMEPLAKALGVSVVELFKGQSTQNRNLAGHMLRTKLYLCPHCGNVIHAMGEATMSCCGRLLQPAEAQESDEMHRAYITPVEDEIFLLWEHPMTKEHSLDFVLFAQDDGYIFKKLYPEGPAEVRLPGRRHGWVYFACTRDGLFRQKI